MHVQSCPISGMRAWVAQTKSPVWVGVPVLYDCAEFHKKLTKHSIGWESIQRKHTIPMWCHNTVLGPLIIRDFNIYSKKKKKNQNPANLPMFFILIFASGGISSGSLCKHRRKHFTSTANVNLIKIYPYVHERNYSHRPHRKQTRVFWGAKRAQLPSASGTDSNGVHVTFQPQPTSSELLVLCVLKSAS